MQKWAYLIGLWGITNSIVEALAFHHNPDRCAAKTFTLVTAVRGGCIGKRGVSGRNGVEVKVDSDYLAQAGMTERLPVWRERCPALYRQ